MKRVVEDIIFQRSGNVPDRMLEHHHILIKTAIRAHIYDRTLIIYSHGNAAIVEEIEPMLNKLSDECNADILAYEYPGYARCVGNASSGSINAEITYMYGLATNEYKYREKNIVLMGRSIGTGPTVYLASTLEQCAAMILISPFTTIRELIDIHSPIPYSGWMLSWVIDELFDNGNNMTNVDTKLLVVHGALDKVIPVEMGQRLLDLSNNPASKIFRVPDGTHNVNVWQVNTIRTFIQ